MRRRLPLICLILFGVFLAIVIALANSGRGFWGFLQDVPYGDKLGHLGLVGTLSLLLNLTLRNRRLPPPLARLGLGTALVIVGMTLEELTQHFLPHRTADLFDWLANVVGAFLGGLLASRLSTAPSHLRENPR